MNRDEELPSEHKLLDQISLLGMGLNAKLLWVTGMAGKHVFGELWHLS